MRFCFVGITLCILSCIFSVAQCLKQSGQMSDDCFSCLCQNFFVNCSQSQPHIVYDKHDCHVCKEKSSNKPHNFKLLLEPTQEGSAKHFTVKMIINSPNADGNGTDVKIYEVKLPIHPEVALNVRGISFPEVVSYNASKNILGNKISETDIGPEVLHVYQIENKGPTSVKKAEVYILWPTYASEGKSLLYLMGQPEVQGNAKCKVIDVNPLKLQVVQNHNLSMADVKQLLLSSDLHSKEEETDLEDVVLARKKREHDFSFLSDSAEAEDAFEEESSCGLSKCTKIHCEVSDLDKGDQVIFSIRSRLWRETYNEIGENEVIISSKLLARITALPTGENTGYLPYKEYMVSTEVNILNASSRCWWVVTLSTICGFTLLGLLALACWKVDIFKRKGKQDEEPLKARNGYCIASDDAAL